MSIAVSIWFICDSRSAARRSIKWICSVSSLVCWCCFEVVRELVPLALAREEAVERRERDLRRVVEGEHLAVRGDGLVGPAELALVHLGHLRVERLAIVRLGRQLD